VARMISSLLGLDPYLEPLTENTKHRTRIHILLKPTQAIVADEKIELADRN